MNAPTPPAQQPNGLTRWERFSRAFASGFRRYAEWLVGITWKKFCLLSVLLMIASGILSEIPPFSIKFTVSDEPGATKAERKARAEKLRELRDKYGDVDIKIDESGIHITRKKPAAPAEPAPAAPPASSSLMAATPESLSVKLPKEVADEMQAAIDEVREEIRNAIEQEIEQSIRRKVRTVRIGSFLPQLALLFILVSMVIKIAYAGRIKAEVRASAAQETADSESLRRQVVEARMAAMQAQVEPHFLFNTLASIDHLIEVDPQRASRMQKNLIALLRASMPGMREGASDLGREISVVRPYLEILKVRMGERLQTEMNVPEGLHSAEFPPMMLQSLVENAIKHGLEPKAEGGKLAVNAEIAHGKLVVSVADTGVGFARAPTAGTGVGLSNIRERLKLLYDADAELRVAGNEPSGTRVSIVVPYRTTNAAAKA